MTIHEIIHAWETGKLPTDLNALMAIQNKVDDYHSKAADGLKSSGLESVRAMYGAECHVYYLISKSIDLLVDKIIPEPQEKGGVKA